MELNNKEKNIKVNMAKTWRTMMIVIIHLGFHGPQEYGKQPFSPCVTITGQLTYLY